jgi:hypothetical protein
MKPGAQKSAKKDSSRARAGPHHWAHGKPGPTCIMYRNNSDSFVRSTGPQSAYQLFSYWSGGHAGHQRSCSLGLRSSTAARRHSPGSTHASLGGLEASATPLKQSLSVHCSCSSEFGVSFIVPLLTQPAIVPGASPGIWKTSTLFASNSKAGSMVCTSRLQSNLHTADNGEVARRIAKPNQIGLRSKRHHVIVVFRLEFTN